MKNIFELFSDDWKQHILKKFTISLQLKKGETYKQYYKGIYIGQAYRP